MRRMLGPELECLVSPADAFRVWTGFLVLQADPHRFAVERFEARTGGQNGRKRRAKAGGIEHPEGRIAEGFESSRQQRSRRILWAERGKIGRGFVEGAGHRGASLVAGKGRNSVRRRGRWRRPLPGGQSQPPQLVEAVLI